MGSIHVQTPKVITPDSVAICRLAWLPDDETLLRVEAGVSALQPLMLDDDSMIGFEPPSLSSMRCDMMKKTGELDNAERPFRGATEGGDEAASTNEASPVSTTVKNGSVAPAAKKAEPTDARDSLSL